MSEVPLALGGTRHLLGQKPFFERYIAFLYIDLLDYPNKFAIAHIYFALTSPKDSVVNISSLIGQLFACVSIVNFHTCQGLLEYPTRNLNAI